MKSPPKSTLPEVTNKTFFNDALSALKKKGILHFYTFASTEKQVEALIKANLKGCRYKITEIRKVRPYAPRIWNYVADIKVLSRASLALRTRDRAQA